MKNILFQKYKREHAAASSEHKAKAPFKSALDAVRSPSYKKMVGAANKLNKENRHITKQIRNK